jgi:hypothetical protein
MMIAASATTIMASPAAQAATLPSLGVAWFPSDTNGNNGGQCGSPAFQVQTVPANNWSTPLRVDTDGRSGGCEAGWAINDPSNLLAGLSINGTWTVSPGGNAGQCGSVNSFPVTINNTGGPTNITGIFDDTDDRAGYCNLAFSVAGRSNVALDVQYYADPSGSAGQCVNALPQGSFYTASVNHPISMGLDTDSRPGGCWLQFRLRLLS